MKLLLDENLPYKLKKDLFPHEVFTVVDVGWSGYSNGRLLQLMHDNQFTALITFDKNLQYQQNFKKYSLTVFVLNAEDNTYDVLKQLMPLLVKKIEIGLQAGPIEIKIET